MILPYGNTPAAAANSIWDSDSPLQDDQDIRRFYPLYGVTSFDEMEDLDNEDFITRRLGGLNTYFQLIAANILNNPNTVHIGASLHGLVSEYGRRRNMLETGTAPQNAADENRILPDEGPMDTKKAMKVKSPIKREGGIDYTIRDYAYTPTPDASGWKLRLAEGAPGRITIAQLGRAAAALSPGGFRGNRVQMPATAVSAIKRRIRSEYRKLKVPDEKIPNSVKEIAGRQLFVWKVKETGQHRWFAVYSNNFLDKDSPPEIISEKSHLRFVDMVDKGIVDYPELWHWHVLGSAWGKADMVDYTDGFAIASGYIYPGHEAEAEALANRKDLGVSHGMPYATMLRRPEEPNVIDFHITREISDLPHYAAANPLTDFVILQQGAAEMAIRKDKRKYLIEEAGLKEEFVDQIENNLKEMSELARSVGLDYKAAGDDEDEYADEYADEEDFDDEEEVVDEESDDDPDMELDAEDEETDEESEEGEEEEEGELEPVGQKARRTKRGGLWTSGSRTKPSSFAASRKRGGLWTSGGREKPSSFAGSRTRGRPQSGTTGGSLWTSGSRNKPSSFAASRKRGRPQSGTTGASREEGSLWTSGGREKPSSFAGSRTRGRPQSGTTGASRKKPSSFAAGKRPKRRSMKEAPPQTVEYVTVEDMLTILTPLVEQLTQHSQIMTLIADEVKELHRSAEERIAETKESTPRRSLQALMDSISIGKSSTQVDGRTSYGKEGPQETETPSPAYTPIPFVNGLIQNNRTPQ